MTSISSFNLTFSGQTIDPLTQIKHPFCSCGIPTGYSAFSDLNFRVGILRPEDPQLGRLKLLKKIEFVLENQLKPDADNSTQWNALISRVDELRYPLKWLDYIGSFFYTTDYQAQCEQAYLRIKSLLQHPLHG